MLSELHTLNDIWLRAWFEKDAATVDRLMADDYVYVAPNGRVLDRGTILGIIRTPSYRLDNGHCTEVVVRLLGSDAAVIRKRWHGTGTFEGTAFTDDQRLVMVWARRGTDWQLVLEQATTNSR
jgi:ketosteroid isomerase-like protein